MQITKDTKISDVVHLNYLLLPILNRFDIQLGFGDKSVKEICAEKDLNVMFFLEIVNSFNDKTYFPKNTLLEFPVKIIIDYLKKTHDYYREIKIPQVAALINTLIEKTITENKNNVMLVNKFFEEYKEELLNHINREESIIQPYIIELEQAYVNGDISTNLLKTIKEFNIDDFEKEHDNMEDKLYDLKNILIKYLPPNRNNDLLNSIVIELFRLERDLNDHARIEDKVLIPKVRFLENALLKERG